MPNYNTDQQKVKEITDKLEQGLKELFESEKYKAYLSTMSKFHNYSFNNTLLIAMQKPDATLVAGYQAWQKNFDRHVNKGEKGIRILAPAPYKIKEERDILDPITGDVILDNDGMPQKEEVEVTIPAFRAVSVFDVSQTDGKPIPELETQELLASVEGYEDFMNALKAVSPVPIEFADIPGGAYGYFSQSDKKIVVQEGLSESQTLKTTIHEVAHSKLHDRDLNAAIDSPAKDRNTKEVEAESVAYTVCQHFGIDTSEYSFSYVAGWSSGKQMQELKSSLDTIRKTASELITEIETQLRDLQRERESMRDQDLEKFLLVQDSKLSEYSLLSVRGMEADELINALSGMKDDDKLNIAAFLESKGAWVSEIANQDTREWREYHLDVRYLTDKDEIIDLSAEKLRREKAEQPITPEDVIVKMIYEDGEQFEIAKITNKTPEEVPAIMEYMLANVDDGWDSNVEKCLTDNGVEYIPFIVSEVDSGIPEFYDYEVNLETEQITSSKDLSPAKQAEGFINRLEYNKTLFSDDERNLIVNHAYKIGDVEKTKALAERLYREKENGEQASTISEMQAEIEALPDSMVGISEMNEYGYEWTQMLPLTQEMALELFDKGFPVYLLHEDNSETLVEGREQLEFYEGMCGIEKNDWEKGKNRMEITQEVEENSVNMEAQLLYGSKDKYGIYQLKDDPELFKFHFEGTEALNRMGYGFDSITPENYDLIYVGDLSELKEATQGGTLEAIYEKFNIAHPQDFKGHSLSVSDIVVLHEDGQNSTHFVDSYGFTEFPDFTKALEGIKEQEADKAEINLTDEEKQFLETDNAPMVAKEFLAWDEIEGLGYRFFEDGYIDKFKPHEKALFGRGLVSDLQIYDMARRMKMGEDIREELAKSLIGRCERITDVGENNVVAVFRNDVVTVTFGNAEENISYEELGSGFLSLFESEYKDIVKARAAEESELAFQIGDRYLMIHESDNGYDYSILGLDYKEIDGGLYENLNVSIYRAAEDIAEDLKTPRYNEQTDTFYHSAEQGNIGVNDELMLVDYETLEEKMEEANRIMPSTVVADFKEKTKELFREIADMNPDEIEETIKCHVQAKIDEYGLPAEIVDVAITGTRCRGLERYGSDLDVVVELSTHEREDDLFFTFNEDGLHIGGIKVDINPITTQRSGTLETYLPQVEEYLDGVREARALEPISLFNIRMNDDERWYRNTSGLDVEGLCRAYAECKLPFVEMGKYGERLSAPDHAYMEQSSKLGFSLEFNAETDQIKVFDGEKSEYMGLKATLFQAKEVEVTLTVAECGEFHNLGAYYEEIPTVEEALELFASIPAEQMNGIPAIGIQVHVPGEAPYQDTQIDIYSGRKFDLDIFAHVPEIAQNEKALALVAELLSNLPEAEIIGEMPKELQKAVEEYKPLAKIEEVEEQNFNMIDNVLNNGVGEKEREKKEKVEQVERSERPSLKEKLEEKRAEASTQSTYAQPAVNDKNTKREVL